MTPISIDLSKSWDYAEPWKQWEQFSGVLDIDISVDELTDNPSKNLFDDEIRDAVMKQTAELLLSSDEKWEARGLRTSGWYPSISAEVESGMDWSDYRHKMRVGVTMPNPKDYSSEQCLDVYAHHIASAIWSILPTKLDLLKNRRKGTLYTAGEMDFMEDGKWLELKNFDSRVIPKRPTPETEG